MSRTFLIAASTATLVALPAFAQTSYPLALSNCGVDVTFDKAPASVVTVGQAATEVLYSLDLAD